MSVDELSQEIETLSLSHNPRLSVLDDYEQIAHELLKPTYDELLEFKCIHWDIKEWWDLPDRVVGPGFEAGGHEWNLLLFPKGGIAESFVSVYLKWANSSRNPFKKSVRTQFAVCLSTPSQPTNYLGYGTEHVFNSEHDDWGFAHIVEVDCIGQKNWRTGLGPLLEYDKIRVSVMIRVLKNNDNIHIAIPSASSNSNHAASDPDQPTSTDSSPTISGVYSPMRFSGIKSMDDTGCLSILLQLLYFTSHFRRSTYTISEADYSCDALTALLQLFTQLDTSSSTVDVSDLVDSLGWDYEDLLMQRDIIQFKQSLQSALELKCPAFTPIYQRIFGVKYDGGDAYEYALSLEIGGYPDLQTALFDHVFSNGMIIAQLPPVLHIHLKRFWYNHDEDYVEKINTRFTYPLEIDLDPFVDSTNDRSESFIYVLQSVIVHDAELSNGMYYAHIRPTCEGSNWIKVQDDQITPSSEADALEKSYGGTPADDIYAAPQTHNAYMLSFVRKSRLQEMIGGTSANDEHHSGVSTSGVSSRPPALFTDYFVSIVTDATFRASYNQFDLFDTKHPSVKKLYIDKTSTTLNTLEAAVSELVGIPSEKFRLWTIVRRQNKTFRPDVVIKSQNKDQLITERIITQCAKSVDQSFVMYLETPISPRISSLQILLFIKYFDIEAQSIQGVGHIIVDEEDQVGSIAGIINALVGTPIDMQLDMYEEIRPGMIDRLQDTVTFAAAEIQHGDIICAQRHLSDEEKSEMSDLFVDAKSFYSTWL